MVSAKQRCSTCFSRDGSFPCSLCAGRCNGVTFAAVDTYPCLTSHLATYEHGGCSKDPSDRALRALSSFAKGLKAKFSDIEIELDYEPEAGLADNGDLDGDLTALFIQIGTAAKAADTALIIFVDDMQHIEPTQLGALISALHRVSQLALPVMLVGAGLPQIRGRAGNARSYAERLFDYPEIKPLD